ncbi:MAG: GNAT family N-acetyltransferase [Rhodobiaceae bacterium]|nr:MAG: GNAT family N-acetyltransferase [Rhodobiaceae bacterium]
MLFDIIAEAPEHGPQIDALHDLSFGPGRYVKTAYRLREGVAAIPELSFVVFAEEGDARRMVGSIRYSPVLIGGKKGLLLGPLAMDPAVRGQGGGQKLMQVSLDVARELKHGLVILVGDLPYYAKAGFKQVPSGRLTLPGPVDKTRLLYCELSPGAFDGVEGSVEKM